MSGWPPKRHCSSKGVKFIDRGIIGCYLCGVRLLHRTHGVSTVVTRVRLELPSCRFHSLVTSTTHSLAGLIAKIYTSKYIPTINIGFSRVPHFCLFVQKRKTKYTGIRGRLWVLWHGRRLQLRQVFVLLVLLGGSGDYVSTILHDAL